MASVSSLCKNSPKYYVVLNFASVIYSSKLLISKIIKRLVFVIFLSKTFENSLFAALWLFVFLNLIMNYCSHLFSTIKI
jgi:hypothetical protein